MLEQLVQTMRAAVSARWSEQLPMLLARAQSFSSSAMVRVRCAETRDAEIERVIREAYMTGYRQGYADGIQDLMESVGDEDGCFEIAN